MAAGIPGGPAVTTGRAPPSPMSFAAPRSLWEAAPDPSHLTTSDRRNAHMEPNLETNLENNLENNMETNWAGNHIYRATRLSRPTSVEQLQQLVAAAHRVHALGSRHSFTDIADTEGVLIWTGALPNIFEIDEDGRSVTVAGGTTYGAVAEALHTRGWALANLASLPHISVAGAVATGTHGSGNRNGSLASAVNRVDLVRPDGELRRFQRGDADFPGIVVSLGALGIVTSLSLDIEPTFELRQDVYTDVPWDALEEFDSVSGGAYSVSFFTDWVGECIDQVWLKYREDDPASASLGRSLGG